jgi:uncharacterized protein (DUF302 family)
MNTTAYGIRTEVNLSYEQALEKVRATLAAAGFGILSEIDVRAKMKEKLGVDFPRYVILGACNPPLAHQALLAEPDIGLLLPCNVVVYEQGPRRSVVAALDPNAMVSATGNRRLEGIARDARTRLEQAIGAMEKAA